MTDQWELHRRFWHFYIARAWPCFLLLVASSFVGTLLGTGYSGVPAQFRIYWLGPIIAGILAGLATHRLAEKLRVRSKIWITAVGLTAGSSVFAAYTHQSLNKFAMMAAIESEDSKAARLFLERLEAGEKTDFPQSERDRWIVWRSRPFGPPPAPWPHVIAFSELLVAGVAGGIAAFRSSSANANIQQFMESTEQPTVPRET